MAIAVFGDFSFGIIFQQVSLMLVTHCAGGFGVGWGVGLGGIGRVGLGCCLLLVCVWFNAQPQYLSRFGW